MADPQSPATSFLGKFTVLQGAARELWLTFAVKLLSISALKIVLNVPVGAPLAGGGGGHFTRNAATGTF